eukprot:c17698_g1_i1.p1 GENE.c17698_g1_i1~~c17698_g1_i1.p1  ORF type:complete len:215 (+),score=49.85 c17698_g1_i1:44-646(+)
MAKIAVVYYSTYGHVQTLAEAVKKGVEEAGHQADIFQVPETLPTDILEKIHAPAKADYPIATAATLPEYDGIAFGFPTRFGTAAAQMKAFWDSLGQLWQNGSLVGKAVTVFTSTATQVGGQETTILTSIPVFAHHGLVFVPVGYSYGSSLFDVSTVRGGGPFGAGTIAGSDGSRQPSEVEIGAAVHQGSHFAKIAAKLAA